jgi:hypothetical protein
VSLTVLGADATDDADELAKSSVYYESGSDRIFVRKRQRGKGENGISQICVETLCVHHPTLYVSTYVSTHLRNTFYIRAFCIQKNIRGFYNKKSIDILCLILLQLKKALLFTTLFPPCVNAHLIDTIFIISDRDFFPCLVSTHICEMPFSCVRATLHNNIFFVCVTPHIFLCVCVRDPNPYTLNPIFLPVTL